MSKLTEKQRDFLRLFGENGLLSLMAVDPYRYNMNTLHSLVRRELAYESNHGIYSLTDAGRRAVERLPGMCTSRHKYQPEGCDELFDIDCDREEGHSKDHFNWKNHVTW